MAGRKNIVFGFFYLVFIMVLGLWIADRGAPAGADEVLASAFLRANTDSVLNIMVGYLIRRLPFADWLSRAVSVLMITGALLHSGTLCLAGLGLFPPAAVIMPFGALIIMAVMLFMGIGVLGIRAVR